jgi:hypothetical protein
MSLVEAFFVRSTFGAGDSLGGVSPGQMARHVFGHIRFLFGVTTITIAIAGGVLAPWLGRATGRPERRFETRAWTTAAGLAAFATLYSLPLLQAVVVHRYWLIVALPLVSFLVGAAVHATATGVAARIVWFAAAAVLGTASTRFVLATQRADRTPFYEELGTALHDLVPLGVPLATTERESDVLDFYSERRISYGFGDRDLDRFPSGAAGPVLPDAGFCAVVEPSIDPARPSADRLVTFLKEHWEATRVRLDQSGADLFLFDFSKRKHESR